MFLRAGLISLALLLASRVAGLLRESAQAAAFGTSATGDVAVLMLMLPDWLAGVAAGGALAYVLLPQWARQDGERIARTQRRAAFALAALGALLALAVGALARPLAGALIPGLPDALVAQAVEGLRWSAVAIPLALLAALWVTRLQHERDFLGMYAASLVVNGVLVAGLLWLAAMPGTGSAVTRMGAALVAAAALRLAWLRWRLPPSGVTSNAAGTAPALPGASLWVWAIASSGLPLVLPFAARSLASQSGEGALAAFNYAWKLVELPLVLAIQLVASLAFPVITRAFAAGGDPAPAVRRAFALAWTLACAAAAGLLVGAPAAAALLFGWGRMGPEGLSAIGSWGAVGAWGLLPQALTAVAITVLATQGRLRPVALAYGAALLGLFLASPWAGGDGGRLMLLLNAVQAAVALLLVGALGPRARAWLPWRGMVAALAALLLAGWAAARLPPAWLMENTPLALILAGCAAMALIAIGWLADADTRAALRR